MKPLALIALLSLATPALAGETAQVADLAWMAGSWSQETDRGTVRETWLPPLTDAMAGMTQTHRPDKPPVTEFSTITREPAGVTFTAYVAGQPPTAFVLRPGKIGRAHV